MGNKKKHDVDEVVEDLQVQGQESEETLPKPLSQKSQKLKDKVRVKFETNVAFGRIYSANVTHEFTQEEFKKLKATSFSYTVV